VPPRHVGGAVSHEPSHLSGVKEQSGSERQAGGRQHLDSLAA
jgi:hypothetical protein